MAELEANPLAKAIRAARERDQLSIRELARRSGVSAGQISRIEAGEVTKPAMQTVIALARALGRSEGILLFLSGHVSEEEATATIDRAWAHLEPLSEHWANVGDAFDAAEDQEAKHQAAQALFLSTDLGGFAKSFDISSDPGREELGEIATAWPALTPARRRLVLAIVADQEVLSSLDRMPTPPGRYDFDVQLDNRREPNE